MSRVVYSPESCLQYLEQHACKENCVVGLILGQKVQGRENIIHLTRTPDEKVIDNTSSDGSYSSSETAEPLKNLLAVSEAWVADHAKHVTRMLPGGMFVQGIFVISDEDVFDDPNLYTKVRMILSYTFKILETTAYMYGNHPDTNERLVLHMSTSTKVLNCKSIEEILQSAHKSLHSSVMFIDGELKESTDNLEQFVKKKKNKSNSKSTQEVDPTKSMHITLFVPIEHSLPAVVEYMECDGSIHFSGVVSSSVFMDSKATVSEVHEAVKQDILRSLASRFTMHCDALIDDNLLPEEKVCFNEPPRRVLVPVGSLYLCDYLFPGEAPAEALLSVRELLDLNITEADVVCDVETPADTSEFDALDRDASSEESLASPQEANRFMYIAGIGFALFVLVLSIVIHYSDTIIAFLKKII
ncbi:Protein odr-4 homolog [Eumeta japonica]|uniref:Protein odr-4 homolog n=1 Tax=Eumeta variegata TaxID=151549 RepID=A0A4C1SQ85_EUMVA|nr:Protein odr-4 homolog [Eumeta japonica]